MRKAQSISQWVDSFMAKPRVDSVIEHILPSQAGEYVVIAGRTGIGKTNLALTLAHHIASGQEWGRFSVKQNRCLYTALEGDEGNILSRIVTMGKHFDGVDGYLRGEFVQRNKPQVMFKQIQDVVTDEKVIIIDGGRLIFDKDYCKAKDTDSMVTSLMRWLRDSGLVAIITLQITKPGRTSDRRIDADDVYNVKGATELVDSATSVLVMEKHKRTDLINIYFTKHRIAAVDCPTLTVEWVKDECRFKNGGEVSQ